jgi:hypothetical protein
MPSSQLDRRSTSPLAALLAGARPAAASDAVSQHAAESAGAAGRLAATRRAQAVVDALDNPFAPLLITLHSGEQVLAMEGGVVADGELHFSLAPFRRATQLAMRDVAACQPLDYDQVAALASLGEQVITNDHTQPDGTWKLRHAYIVAIDADQVTLQHDGPTGAHQHTVNAAAIRYPDRYPFDPFGWDAEAV